MLKELPLSYSNMFPNRIIQSIKQSFCNIKSNNDTILFHSGIWIKIETLGICLKTDLKWQQSVLLKKAQDSTLGTPNKTHYATSEYHYPWRECAVVLSLIQLCF